MSLLIAPSKKNHLPTVIEESLMGYYLTNSWNPPLPSILRHTMYGNNIVFARNKNLDDEDVALLSRELHAIKHLKSLDLSHNPRIRSILPLISILTREKIELDEIDVSYTSLSHAQIIKLFECRRLRSVKALGLNIRTVQATPAFWINPNIVRVQVEDRMLLVRSGEKRSATQPDVQCLIRRD